MKTIEEYNVTGTFADEPVKGKVTAYLKTILKNVPLGLKTSVLQTFKQAKKKTTNLITNVVDYTNKHPELRKNMITGAMVLVMAATFTGCSMKPKATTDINDLKPAFEHVIQEKEATGKIEYEIKFGDTLGEIVGRYTSDVTREIDRICKENDISDPNRIYQGKKIILNIPISKLADFGYSYTFGEINEWDAMDHFIRSVFDVPESELHPDNFIYWRDKQIVTGDYIGEDNKFGLEKRATTDLPILMEAASARQDLETMTEDQFGFYSEEDIETKEDEITSIYHRALDIAKNNTTKVYGKDYLLDPPIVVTPLEPEKGMSK